MTSSSWCSPACGGLVGKGFRTSAVDCLLKPPGGGGGGGRACAGGGRATGPGIGGGNLLARLLVADNGDVGENSSSRGDNGGDRAGKSGDRTGGGGSRGESTADAAGLSPACSRAPLESSSSDSEPSVCDRNPVVIGGGSCDCAVATVSRILHVFPFLAMYSQSKRIWEEIGRFPGTEGGDVGSRGDTIRRLL